MGMNLNHVIVDLSLFSQFFSRIFEKIMYNRLKSFFNKHDIFFQKQYGFRDNRSTEHAILDIVNKIQENSDKGKSSCGCFYRFTKSVRHRWLLYPPVET